MNWFNQWLANRVKAGLASAKEKEERIAINQIKNRDAHVPMGKPISHGELDSHPDLTFRMYKAYNGMVMEVRGTDRKTDRHTSTLHLISDGEDLGDSISKIITLETLRS